MPIAIRGRTIFRQLLAGRPWLEILLLMALGTFFVWRAFVPAWRSLNTDFPNYYLAARLYRQGDSLAQVYDWIWFQRQKDYAGMETRIVGFIPLTLYSAMPVLPLTTLPPLAAKRWWLAVSLLLLVLTGLLIRQMTTLGTLRIGVLGFLAIEPLKTHFLCGQVHILVLFLLALSLWLYLKERPILSGLMLALASAIKIYPIFFVFYFIRKKQWRATAGLIGGAILLASLAIWLFGMEVNRVYLGQILPRILRGENIDPYSLNWNSFAALFRRLFIFEPELNPRPFVNFPPAFAVSQALAQALLFVPFLWLLTPGRTAAEKEKLEFAAYIAMLLLLSTSPASYHYIVLILCAAVAADSMLHERRHSQTALFVLFYSLACLPARLFPHREDWPVSLFAFSRLFFTLALFILLLVVLSSEAPESWSQRLRSRSALVFLPVFAVILLAGYAFKMRHLKGEFANYTSRLVTTPGSLMMTQPSASRERIAFAALNTRAYTIVNLKGNRLSSCAFTGDAFHPALDLDSSRAWVELAGRTSTIVSLDLSGCGAASPPVRAVVENGEQPAVSPDGKWLAFIREVRGRGSLWIKDLRPDKLAGAGAGIEREMAGPEYNVLDAAFEGKAPEIVFAAVPHGKPALFKTGLASMPVTQITFGSPARYPAISPDGRWLAYCKLKNGDWHLWLKPSGSGPERQLVEGDCNSIYPAWMPDSKDLIYATDCGRGLDLTALARIRAVP